MQCCDAGTCRPVAGIEIDGRGRVIVLRNTYDDGLVTVRNSYIKILELLSSTFDLFDRSL